MKLLALPVAAAMAAIASIAATGPVAAQHGARHPTYAAGKPGDPAKPARTIEVVMSEMEYKPSLIEVKRGEQIRFAIRNAGTEDHEFMLSTTKENLAHAAMMKKHPHMKHDEPNGVTLAPKQSAELLWKFTKAGTFEYSCLIPDHREYGMTGRVVVK